jgi:hypothetical protein
VKATIDARALEKADVKLAEVMSWVNDDLLDRVDKKEWIHGLTNSGKLPLRLPIQKSTTQKYKNLLKTAKGEVYGFTLGSEVFIDQNLMNANRPVHEFGHLWNTFIKKNNKDLWRKGVELIQGTSYWNNLLNDPAYSYLYRDKNNLTEEEIDAIADEALATVVKGCCKT